jgi:putative addiction module killer protein
VLSVSFAAAIRRLNESSVSYLIQSREAAVKAIYTTPIFDAWFSALRDRRLARLIQVRIDRAEDGNFGDSKPVGAGVSEMRIHHGAGYRLYFMHRGLDILIFLAGGDKASQDKDIASALRLAQEIKERYS